VSNSDVVDLGQPAVVELAGDSEVVPAKPPSDVSDVPWTALVMDADEEAASAAAKIDSPSDVDLLAHAAPPASPPADDSAVGGEPFVAEVASDSSVRAEAFVTDVDEAQDDETSAINLGALAARRDEDSAVEAEVADSSGKHPGTEPMIMADDEAAPPDQGGLATEPDIGAAPAPHRARAEEDDTHFLDDVAEVEAGSSAVNLGEPARPTDRPSSSSRDLIAEAVESGVDLGNQPAEGPSSDAVVVEAADSAVDLGSAAVEETPSSGPEAVRERKVPPGSHHDIDLDAEAEEEQVDLSAAAAEEEAFDAAVAEDEEPAPGSSGVDLGGTAGRAPKHKPSGSSSIDFQGATDAREKAAADEEDAADALADDEEAVPSGRGRARRAVAEVEDEEAPAPAAEDEDEEAPAPKRRAAAAAEDEDEEAPAPKKPPRARAGCGCLVLAALLGLLIGAAAPIGLAMFDVFDSAKQLNSLLGTGTPSKSNQPKPDVGPKAPVVEPGQHLKNGDFAKAAEGLKGSGDAPEVQAQRGTAVWMQYLQEQMGKGAPIKADDEAVKSALKDLTDAAQKDNPEAILALGNLQEYTGTPAKALETYEQAAPKFKDKPTWARALQAQIDRLKSNAPRPAEGAKPGEGAKPTTELPRPDDDRATAARALVALLLAFQAEAPAPGGAGAGDGADDEAGFSFWAAIKAAQDGNYDQAITQLEAARKAHDKLRFARLRKAQNPLSDPTEEIFLRCARELDAYLRVQYYLKDQGVLAKGGDPQKAIKDVFTANVKMTNQLKATADALKTTPDALANEAAKLVKENDVAQAKVKKLEKDLTDVRKEADTAKKDYTDTLVKLNTATTDLKAANDRLKAVGDRLEAAGVKNPDPAKGVDALAAERAAAEKTLATAADKLAPAHVKVDKKDLLQGIDRVVEAALTKDPKGELMASRDEVKRLNLVLTQRRTPTEMLDVWLPILLDRSQKGAAEKAIVDTDRVRFDPATSPAAKKKALAVLGLARRDLGEAEAARPLLADALASPKADWQPPVAQVLKELTDPNAYYVPRARELYKDGKVAEAYAVLAEARKLFPKDAAQFQALDSLIQLEIALDKGKGKIDPASPAVIEAKAAAQKAADAGNAEGHYALGRINEELGNLAEANISYAKALTAHPADDEAGARYRLARARVLKRQAAEKAGGRAAAPAGGIPTADGRRQTLTTLLLLVELGMQAPVAPPDADEATKLLDQVLNAKDGPDTFMLRAQALALKGLWTPALKTYATGLRAHVRRDYADGLADLIERHPALRRPPSMDPPNPLLAEANYATGLRHYFARRYGDAEAAFLKAIEYDNQDARYFYFLGLSRLPLNKAVDADADFREGAQLELLNRPGREAVSTALERVQGPARQEVNRVRP
jgi:tetratricopeptide (TPR) repeat protein